MTTDLLENEWNKVLAVYCSIFVIKFGRTVEIIKLDFFNETFVSFPLFGELQLKERFEFLDAIFLFRTRKSLRTKAYEAFCK